MVSLKAVSGIGSCLACETPEAILLFINAGFEAFAVNRSIKLSLGAELRHGKAKIKHVWDFTLSPSPVFILLMGTEQVPQTLVFSETVACLSTPKI